MSRRPYALSVVTLLLPALALAAPPATMPTTTPASQPTAAKFLRFNDTPGQERLETSVVTYKNAAGQTVDLIGAVHIADHPYYVQLNNRFKQYDALLYEMVKPKGSVMPKPGAMRKGGGGFIGGMQRGMKDILDLTYQLDEVDYTKPNFVHADMDAETFERLQDERGEGFFAMFLKSALSEAGKADSNRPQMSLGELLLALKSPDKAKQLKLLVGRQFADAEDLTSSLEGPNGSVILTERNKAAFAVLKDHIEKGDKKIGVFYGAAHLKGMEALLLPMGFTQVGQPVWLKAWEIGGLPSKAPATRPTTSPAAR